MKNKMLHIAIYLIMGLILFGVINMKTFEINETFLIDNKTSEIIINDNGTIDVIDNVQIGISEYRR